MTEPEPEPHPDSAPPSQSGRDRDSIPANEAVEQNDGPGWMPAILAGGLLLLMAFFVCCGISTAYLWNQRGEMAVRTLRGHTMPMVEQSQLPPQEKQSINNLLESLADQIESGQLENSQVSGIMTRLQMLPIGEWGDLAAVEAMIEQSDEWTADQKKASSREFSRLRHAVSIGEATRYDLYDVLEPVRRDSPQAASGSELVTRPNKQQLGEVVNRAQLIAERLEIEDRTFSDVSLSTIIRQQIESGRDKGDR